MLKTWSFWKTFFTIYIGLVGGIQVFADPLISFEGESLKQLLGPSWWVYYYLIPLFIALSVATLTNAKAEPQAETLDQRNRRVMVDHVENFWVKGILEKSLHGAALFELGIKEDSSAVSYPWTIKKESTNEVLPAGKSMLEIFREIGMGRSLLILGAPGSGKTTMLLELTRQLLERAQQDETEPIPVVFHLASWKENQTLADWLPEQLNIVYYVPKKIAPSWITGNKMLLLLDGLDEVKPESRAKCVEAINQFRNEYGFTSLVVCCRIEEYTVINTKLLFEGAVALQPLTSRQVNDYFDRFGNRFASVRQFLNKDNAIQELAETPLMLSIMTLAYKDIKFDELLASNRIEDQRKHLFNTYTDRMFQRSTRSLNAPFTKPQTLHYLGWLAQTMIQQNITTFQIESIQPSWLSKQQHVRLYRLSVSLSFGLLAGLPIGLVFGERAGLRVGLIAWLIIWLISGLSVALVYKQIGRETDTITMIDKLKWSRKKAPGGVLIVLSALAIGLILMLLFEQDGGLSVAMTVALGLGLMLGLMVVMTSEQVEETSYPGQHLNQSLFNSLFSTLIIGLGLGLVVGLSFGLSYGLNAGLNTGLRLWLLGGLPFGLVITLFFGLFVGFRSSYRMFHESSNLLIGGYFSLIQHYSLRLVLAQYHLLPLQLIAFLEYSVALIFLRRVGGSYIFIHRLMMEHFAEMDA